MRINYANKKTFFKVVAKIIKNNRPQSLQNEYCHGKKDALDYITIELVDYFEQENPRFDRTRFMKACGLE